MQDRPASAMLVATSPPTSDKQRAKLTAFGLVAAVCALIFALSSFRGDELPAMEPPWAAYLPLFLLENLDKVAHFGVYALLGAVSFRAFSRALPRFAGLVALLFCLAYGASDELHQAFVPGRTPDVLDWLADGAGSAVGILLAAAIFRPISPAKAAAGKARG